MYPKVYSVGLTKPDVLLFDISYRYFLYATMYNYYHNNKNLIIGNLIKVFPKIILSFNDHHIFVGLFQIDLTIHN